MKLSDFVVLSKPKTVTLFTVSFMLFKNLTRDQSLWYYNIVKLFKVNIKLYQIKSFWNNSCKKQELKNVFYKI